MPNTKLAHWRYQVQKLEQWTRNNERSLEYSKSDARQYPESMGLQQWILADHLELTAYGAWLLEEARYMSELSAT